MLRNCSEKIDRQKKSTNRVNNSRIVINLSRQIKIYFKEYEYETILEFIKGIRPFKEMVFPLR